MIDLIINGTDYGKQLDEVLLKINGRIEANDTIRRFREMGVIPIKRENINPSFFKTPEEAQAEWEEAVRLDNLKYESIKHLL